MVGFVGRRLDFGFETTEGVVGGREGGEVRVGEGGEREGAEVRCCGWEGSGVNAVLTMGKGRPRRMRVGCITVILPRCGVVK